MQWVVDSSFGMGINRSNTGNYKLLSGQRRIHDLKVIKLDWVALSEADDPHDSSTIDKVGLPPLLQTSVEL